MRFIPRRPPHLLLLTGVLLVLLLVLAVLQHRWLGQVGASERERLEAGLRHRATLFRRDFDREITRAAVWFRRTPAPIDAELGREWADRFANWKETAPFPGLIRDLYLVEVSAGADARLLRLDGDAKALVSTEWPASLAAWRQAHVRSIETRATGRDVLFFHERLESIAPEIPALIVPTLSAPIEAMHIGASGAPRDVLPRLKAGALFNYTIVILDREYIAAQMLPALAARYFETTSDVDYRFTVYERQKPDAVIYRSDPGAPADAAGPPDVVVDLLQVRTSESPDLVRTEFRWHARLDGPARQYGALAIRVLRSDDRTAPDTIERDIQQAVEAPFDVAPGGAPAPGVWTAAFTHRAGSLEAVVASAGRRNLLVSTGILMLLAVSMVLIVISAQRAGRLADQQIEFVASVTHELRTPLAVIRSAGENLADGVIAGPDHVRRYGALIEREGRRLTEMVEQVLEYAGMHSGRRVYRRQPVSVDELVARALSACEMSLQQDGFTVETSIDPEAPPVLVDAAAVDRALQNLLSNAMKYSGDSRWIGIRATNGDGPYGRDIRIAVEDRGVGLDPGEVDRIFQPFYRTSDSVSAQIHGSGLGLAVVKDIIDAHGGRITVTSEKGKGSTFAVHLRT